MQLTLSKPFKVGLGFLFSFILAFQLEQITQLRTPGVIVTMLISQRVGRLPGLGYAFAMFTVIDSLLVFGVACAVYVWASRRDARKRMNTPR